MKCNKCNIDIPAIFQYMISQNVCGKCGSKLLQASAMKAYLDIKNRLHEVELVMDKEIVYERIAMFLVSNYDIKSLTGEMDTSSGQPLDAKLAAMDNALAVFENDENLTEQEIRDQEAQRAESLSLASEFGLNPDEEMVSGSGIDYNKVERLKRLASSSKTGAMVKRAD